MTDLDRLNSLSVSQLARLQLKKAEAKADPSLPYLLQLVEWGLASQKAVLHRPGYQNPEVGFRNLLDHLMLQKPEWTLNLLLNEGPDESDPKEKWLDPLELRRQKLPQEAAQYVLDRLVSALDSQAKPLKQR